MANKIKKKQFRPINKDRNACISTQAFTEPVKDNFTSPLSPEKTFVKTSCI
ncbi:hypothetical protein JCM6292_719 [Bacteroides pyogenes JCM 6292]|uniref:Uncharacterized protein n=1 Tax=Bacteroides pyogenes JCM 6292 TaxID=1235809 RepID=W4P585_9BACE|nr:hypothetical protein JCM6292_719 [Bacteroides pyogenes JCM 6292]